MQELLQVQITTIVLVHLIPELFKHVSSYLSNISAIGKILDCVLRIHFPRTIGLQLAESGLKYLDLLLRESRSRI